MAIKTVKVVVPTNPKEIIDLAKLVYDKHVADGMSSPLNDVNMADMEGKRASGEVFDALSVKLHKDAVTATENRDLALGLSEEQNSETTGTVDFYLRSVIDVLLGKFRGNEQKLGDWGFTVVEGTRKGRTKKPGGTDPGTPPAPVNPA